jgi:integrase
MSRKRRGSIVPQPSGNYAIRYVDATGHRRLETIGPDPKEAERALTARLRQLDTGEWIEPSQQTLSEFVDGWLARKETRLAYSTLAGYRSFLNGHVLPALGHRPLSTLRTVDFDNLVHQMEANGSTPGSVRNCIVPVRSALTDAVRLGLIRENPASNVDLPAQEDSKGVDIPPEHTQALRAALLELAPVDPLNPDGFDYAAVYAFDLALSLGVRFSELAALRWRHIRMAERTVLIEEAVVCSRTKRPKSNRSRIVPQFPTAHVAFKALAARAVGWNRYAPAELVLPTFRGYPQNPSNWRKDVWLPTRTHANLDEYDYRWSDLRHTCISRLIAEGADVALVQAIAGHAKSTTTLDVYTHLRDERVRQAAYDFDPASVGAALGQ